MCDNFQVPKLRKKHVFFSKVNEKCGDYPPLKSTDLDKILTGGTSHQLLPPCKISSKSERSKVPKIAFEVGFIK